VERPAVTPSKEFQRARAYSSANRYASRSTLTKKLKYSDLDHNPWVDVGDTTFETTHIFTPFTPANEASLPSPRWSSVRRQALTPPSPTRPGPETDDLALPASSALYAGRSTGKSGSALESPTLRFGSTSDAGAQLVGNVPQPTSEDMERRSHNVAVETGNESEEQAEMGQFVPSEELFIDRTGNIIDRGSVRELTTLFVSMNL